MAGSGNPGRLRASWARGEPDFRAGASGRLQASLTKHRSCFWAKLRRKADKIKTTLDQAQQSQ